MLMFSFELRDQVMCLTNEDLLAILLVWYQGRMFTADRLDVISNSPSRFGGGCGASSGRPLCF